MTRLHVKEISLKIAQTFLCQSLTLTLHPGEILGILGPNGCGKTTLLHTLAGLNPPTKGEIWLDGFPLTQLSTKKIAQTIGILFQDFHAHFPQTVWEYCLHARFPHLTYFQKETAQDKRIVEQALSAMELTSLAQKKVATLSGGEKRRAAIAALLTQTPDIYLLDEPTNHLDINYQIKVLSHFLQLANEAKTIILSLHDINLAEQFCQRILLLFPNGLIKTGTAKEMLTQENLTALYEHPIASLETEAVRFWYPRPHFR